MSRWTVALVGIAVSALAFAFAPGLFARGNMTGGGAQSGTNGGNEVNKQPDDGSEPPPEENPESDNGKGITKKKELGKTIDGKDVARDGEEQTLILRDVMDLHARREFARARDILNRRILEPRAVDMSSR
jgi:hypothetical protein